MSTETAAGHGEHGLLRSLAADAKFGPLRALLLTLTVVTGVVDAVSILALGRVFVANMTGNVVFSAFALVGAPGFSLSASLFALAGFLVGAYVGGTIIGRAADRGRLVRAGTLAEVLLVALALLIAVLSSDPGVRHGTEQLGAAAAFGRVVTDTLAALLAIALGVQNAVARKLAVPDLTTTVLTMTLTGVGADLRAVLGRTGAGAAKPGSAGPVGPGSAAARAALGRRLLAVAAMVAGAAAGASLTLHVSAVAGLALAAALLAAVAISAALATRRTAAWRAYPTQKG